MTPRRCAALAKVDEECGASPTRFYRWAGTVGGPPMAFCDACAGALSPRKPRPDKDANPLFPEERDRP